MHSTAVPRRKALLAGSRYELLVKIATGGTATVYVGRISGSVGFQRLVAIKRAHPHLRDDPKARAMLIREANLAARIHHANVAVIQDVEETEDELLLVMSYIEGGSLSDLLDAGELPTPVGLRILLDACAGLGAVHALRDDDGRELGMVHRDVSPQNILVGRDGTSRLTDFGLAKLTEVSMSSTASLQGKIAYAAPEYAEGAPFNQCCDIFSLGVVVWETLAQERLFRGNSDADTLRRVVSEPAPPLSSVCDLPPSLDAVVARALDKDPAARFASVADFAHALAEVAHPIGVATHAEVSDAVRGLIGNKLESRRQLLRAIADPEAANTASMVYADLPIPNLAAQRPSDPPPSQPPGAAPSQPPPRRRDDQPDTAPWPAEDTNRLHPEGEVTLPLDTPLPTLSQPPPGAQPSQPSLDAASLDAPSLDAASLDAPSLAPNDPLAGAPASRGRIVAAASVCLCIGAVAAAWALSGESRSTDAGSPTPNAPTVAAEPAAEKPKAAPASTEPPPATDSPAAEGGRLEEDVLGEPSPATPEAAPSKAHAPALGKPAQPPTPAPPAPKLPDNPYKTRLR